MQIEKLVLITAMINFVIHGLKSKNLVTVLKFGSANLSHAAIVDHALQQAPEVLVADVVLGHDAGERALRVVRTLKLATIAVRAVLCI